MTEAAPGVVRIQLRTQAQKAALDFLVKQPESVSRRELEIALLTDAREVTRVMRELIALGAALLTAKGFPGRYREQSMYRAVPNVEGLAPPERVVRASPAAKPVDSDRCPHHNVRLLRTNYSLSEVMGKCPTCEFRATLSKTSPAGRRLFRGY